MNQDSNFQIQPAPYPQMGRPDTYSPAQRQAVSEQRRHLNLEAPWPPDTARECRGPSTILEPQKPWSKGHSLSTWIPQVLGKR